MNLVCTHKCQALHLLLNLKIKNNNNNRHAPNLQSQVLSSQYRSDETVQSAADGQPVDCFHDSFTKHVHNSFCRQVATHQVPARHKERLVLVNGLVFPQNVSVHTYGRDATDFTAASIQVQG